MIHLYYGDGKGKTTAAMGQALRFVGYGRKVLVVQFLKGSCSGEIIALQKLPQVTVLRNSKDYGFFAFASPIDREKMTRENNENLTFALENIQRKSFDLVVLDEVVDAVKIGALSQELYEKTLDASPEGVELILTGHSAEMSVVKRCHYVTCMTKVKHPYDNGTKAREGVEF